MIHVLIALFVAGVFIPAIGDLIYKLRLLSYAVRRAIDIYRKAP